MDVDASPANNTAATTGVTAMSAEERFELMLLAMTGQPDEEHDEPVDEEETYYGHLAMDMDEEAIYRTGER
jgi:hypothetical protein